ncbi:MAG: class I SAM-dependent methyltransferase [Chlorobi bacterium]|nr:class I SAM-dependent methyltransferase [Chlorobiota bacterium]
MANKKGYKVDSKEAGLEIGLYFFKFFLKSEYLHYGYFTPDLDVNISNLAKAQENYTQMLFSLIPDGVKTILDVGCGSGKIAQKLIEKGYKVDCVSPGNLLTEYVKKLIGDKIELFNCKFEEIQTTKKYDLILFSESFQYIPIKDAIKGFLNYTNKDGYILIADFFKTDAVGKSPIGGGHKFIDWEYEIKKASVKELSSKNITDNTAPTFDIINELSNDVILPVWKVLFLLLEDRFPSFVKFLKWKYKKKLTKLEDKHLTGERNGSNFKKYKKYMVYLFQKTQ